MPHHADPSPPIGAGEASQTARRVPTQRMIAKSGSRPRVYLSSTYVDLIEFRSYVRQGLQTLSVDIVESRDDSSETGTLIQSLADVRTCDLYIGIVAWRYGHVPDEHQRSITELEYEAAMAAGIDCLIFLASEEAPWPRQLMDRGRAEDRVLAFRERLSNRHPKYDFATPAELKLAVVDAVRQWCENSRALGGISTPNNTVHSAWEYYQQRLVSEYQQLDLDALTPPEQEEYLRIKLNDIFVEPQVRPEAPLVELPRELWRRIRDVDTPLPADLPRALDRPDLERARQTHRSRPTRPVFDILTGPSGRRLVLLGDPGAGKSTLARYVTLALAERRPEPRLAAFDGYRPILVELRAFAASLDQHETISSYLEHRRDYDGLGLAAAALDAYLREDGRALAIFDGLDEIFDRRKREAITRQIAHFADSYPNTRVLVTSRVLGYSHRILGGAGFQHFTVADLEQEQIDTFLNSWYSVALNHRERLVAERRQRLVQAIADSPAIKDLAGNPLLLTIMAIIGRHQELPRDRHKVYDYAASVLVQRWDVSKHLPDDENMRAADKKELLGRLAYHMQSRVHGTAGNLIYYDDLMGEVVDYLIQRFSYDTPMATTAASAIIEQLRSRNFILAHTGSKIYGFVHRAFMDYFCAVEIVGQFEKRQTMSEQDLRLQIYGRHWEDPEWTEVLRLISSIVDPSIADRLISYLVREAQPKRSSALDRPPLRAVVLAAQSLAEVQKIRDAATAAGHTLQAIIELLRWPTRSFDDQRDDQFRNAIIPAVKAVGAKWPGRQTFRDWFDEHGCHLVSAPGATFAAVIMAALFSDSREVHQRLKDIALQNSTFLQRCAAVAGLASVWPDETETKDILRQVLSSPIPFVRKVTLETFFRHWPDDPDTRSILEMASLDSVFDIRAAALEALASHRSASPGVRTLLAARASRDPHSSVRRAALELLANRWPDEPESRSEIHRAITDPDWNVRRTAVRAFGSPGWHQDGEARQRVVWACADPDEDVREAAVEVLAAQWAEDPNTHALIIQATRDIDEKVRSAAIKVLANGWPDHPDTRPTILTATSDANGATRCAALGILAHLADDPDLVFHRLSDATLDGWADVRRASVTVLASSWADESTSRALVARAASDPEATVRKAAVEALAQKWPEDPDTYRIVSRAVRDIDGEVREAALQAAQNWVDRPDMRVLLMTAIRSDRWKIRRLALEALISCWSERAETVDILRRACHDPRAEVRLSAVAALADAYPPNSDNDRILRRALHDPDANVRWTAGEHYRSNEPPDMSTLDLCLAAASADLGDIRRLAMDTLWTRWRDDPVTSSTLERLSQDGDADVRYLVVDIYAARPTVDPTTHTAFLDLARDENSSVRLTALRAQLLWWPDAEETKAAVYRSLREDDPRLREVAIEAALLRWPDAAETVGAANEAVVDGTWSVRVKAVHALALRAACHEPCPGALTSGFRQRNPSVRLQVLEAQAGRWPEAQETMTLLIRVATCDVDVAVRQLAHEILAMRLSSQPDVAATVATCRHDPTTKIRLVAGHRVPPGRNQAADALTVAMCRSADPADRLAGLTARILGWPDESTTAAALARAATDEDEAVRAIAHGQLVLRSHYPESLAVLVRATEHPLRFVRNSALRSLVIGWPSTDETASSLRRCLHDPEWSVALTAVHGLAECQPNAWSVPDLEDTRLRGL